MSVGLLLDALPRAATELDDTVGESRPGWAAIPALRRSLAISSHVGERLQSYELILRVPLCLNCRKPGARRHQALAARKTGERARVRAVPR
jgi:hypothetical protein